MSFGGQGQPQGQDQGAGQQNPMLRYYETWSATTPAVARLSIMGLVGVYLFSWLMDLSMYFANVPYYTIYSLELYRVVLSPLVGNSIMTVLIIFLFYPAMATRLENSMGSGAFLALLTTFSMATNLVFLFLCFLMSMLSSDNLPLFWSCQVPIAATPTPTNTETYPSTCRRHTNAMRASLASASASGTLHTQSNEETNIRANPPKLFRCVEAVNVRNLIRG